MTVDIAALLHSHATEHIQYQAIVHLPLSGTPLLLQHEQSCAECPTRQADNASFIGH
jgi:hypothetical protein